MFVRVIPEPSLNVKSFLRCFIPLLKEYLVGSLVNSSAAFINSCIPALRAAYGKDTSNLPRIPPDRIILGNGVFQNFILVDKYLRIYENWVTVNNSLYGKLVSSLGFPIKFDERFKITSVPFFIPDFKLLSYELNNFTFNVLF